MDVSISKAFTIRKRVQNELDKKQKELIKMKKVIRTDDDSEEKWNTNAVEQYMSFMDLLEIYAYLNTVITKANVETFDENNPLTSCPKSILASIEILSKALYITNCFEEAVNGFNPQVKEWDSREYNKDTSCLGNYVVKNYKMIDRAQDVAAEAPCLRKRIQNLEDSLSEMNYTIKVHISKDVEEKLVNLGFV
jgi:hypothetical protein